jgi:hypothetical protein
MSYQRFKKLWAKAKASNASDEWWKVSELADKLALYALQAKALENYAKSAKEGR